MGSAAMHRRRARRRFQLLLLLVTTAYDYNCRRRSGDCSMLGLRGTAYAALGAVASPAGAYTMHTTNARRSGTMAREREREEKDRDLSDFGGRREDDSLRSISLSRTRRKKRHRRLMEYGLIAAGAVGLLVGAALLLRCEAGPAGPQHLPDRRKDLPPPAAEKTEEEKAETAKTRKPLFTSAADATRARVGIWKSKVQGWMEKPKILVQQVTGPEASPFSALNLIRRLAPYIGLVFLIYSIVRHGVFLPEMPQPVQLRFESK